MPCLPLGTIVKLVLRYLRSGVLFEDATAARRISSQITFFEIKEQRKSVATDAMPAIGHYYLLGLWYLRSGVLFEDATAARRILWQLWHPRISDPSWDTYHGIDNTA